MTEAPVAAGIALISAAGAALLRARLGSGPVMRAGFVVAVVATGFLTALWFVVTPRHAAEYLARMGAIIAAVMAISSAGVQWTYPSQDEEGTAHAFVRVARQVALMFGVLSGTILAVVLGVRCVYVAVELVTILPTRAPGDFGFTREGPGSLALLLVACAVGYSATMKESLVTGAAALSTMIGAWAALAEPVHTLNLATGMMRSPGFALLGPWLALMLVVMAVKTRCAPAAEEDHGGGAGWRLWCAVLAVALVLHTAYALAVPMETAVLGMHAAYGMHGVAALVGGTACLTLARSLLSGNLADGGFGLLVLSAAAAAVAVAPELPPALGERYPVVFNAAIAGLSPAAMALAFLAWRWTGQSERHPEDESIALLRFHAKRGVFLCGAIGVVIGGMMAFWPRMQGIATSDFSLGRVLSGLAANLLLFLVLLGCARMYRRPTYYVLAGLVLATGTVFVVMRILPFTPHFG